MWGTILGSPIFGNSRMCRQTDVGCRGVMMHDAGIRQNCQHVSKLRDLEMSG